MSGLVVSREGAVQVLTIDRPHARNAIDHATAAAIAGALDQLDADRSLAAAVITGAGGTFSAGMDLKAFLAGEPREVDGRGFAGLTEAPPAKPLIAAVEGTALAGGCEIVLACDLVVAARDARFGLPEVRRGLIAGSGGLIRLPQRIPPQIALEYALTGDPMPAEVAERWGLVNRLTEPGGALEGALALAARIADNAPRALRASKEIIRRGLAEPEAGAWAHQRALLAELVESADAREGSRAFVEKRAPRWRDA